MIFILKTRAITGALVPALGEHREYTELDKALRDAEVLSLILDEVFVVDFATDNTVAFISQRKGA